ncbi:MAG: acetyl ornithine aminotransferase family protein [Acidobacteria bacterium]|nr:MAG: acetyl ornithine aminotransferase family protein [Acidobacteriota bacterium]
MQKRLPSIKTPLPGPEAQKVLALDRQFISPSYTRDYPLVVGRGEGMFVEDVDGNSFLDFTAGIAVASTGHCHPDVVRAIQRQAETLIHMSGTDFYYPVMAQLAEKLAAIAPGDFPKRVYFGNSGTEAMEAAMKLARYHTGRHRFIAFMNCFHGRTFGSLSLTASKAVQRKGFGPLLSGVTHVPFPNPYRCPYPHPPGECQCDRLVVEFIEHQLFRTLVPPEEVAAIVVEPIQGEGGYVVPPAGFLGRLRELADRHGILLVFDEVQCGMGRTGRMWASEHFGAAPDILITAKGLASGLPLGVMIARADLMDWKPGAHASTFGANPIACAAALETIRLLEEKYVRNAARMGDYILDKLARWPAKHPTVGDVRGKGLMIGIELVKNQKSREPNPESRRRVVERAFELGLLVLGCGESTLRLMPPLVVEPEHADFALEVLDRAIAELEK